MTEALLYASARLKVNLEPAAMLTLVASRMAVAEAVAALPSPTCTLPALMLKVVALALSLKSK